MDLPVILLLDEDDLVFTMRALATGVLLCITKPVPVEIAECLWQVVAGEKIRKGKKMEQFRQLTTPRRLHNGVREEDLGKGCSSGNTSLDDSHKSKKKMKCSKNANQEDNSIFKRKFWIDWTQELHERFVYAIRKLGEGKCYPKDILELMNVPGLTRMQVASHLQKCRRGTYPAGRNLKIAAPMPTSGETSNPAKSKRYGFMPPLLFNHVQENYENYQDQVPMMGSSKGDNVLGCDNEELSVEVYNPFSDVGVEATNMEQAFDMDDMFTAEEKFVLDAQSVAPTPNTSLDAQSSVTDEFFEFPDMDILIQNFYASKQAPIDDGGSSVALDFDQIYSSENEASVVLGAEKSEYGEMAKAEESGETEGLKLEE